MGSSDDSEQKTVSLDQVKAVNKAVEDEKVIQIVNNLLQLSPLQRAKAIGEHFNSLFRHPAERDMVLQALRQNLTPEELSELSAPDIRAAGNY